MHIQGLGQTIGTGVCVETDESGNCVAYQSSGSGGSQNVPIPANLLSGSCPWYESRKTGTSPCTPSTTVVLGLAGVLVLILVAGRG